MLDKDIYPFFKELKENNHKMWFDDNRARYDSIRNSFVSLTEKVIEGIASFDPAIGLLQASKCVYRINRDVRFSTNKEPYKTHMAFILKKGGKSSTNPGYYFHFDVNDPFMGCGVYAPQADILKAIRNEIYFNSQEAFSILNEEKFSRYFKGIDEIERLKNAPKGFEDAPDNVMDLLKNKHFCVSKSLTQKEVLSPNLDSILLERFAAQKEWMTFLNQAIDNL